ncbi:uncharacterized protein A4U43_C07F19220 [Asparagus officinalis]|uniref:Peptidase C1A papain C-terminal domain-containing protein n=1 Tax=Asparagus officinalis TaxID=4686 RepID=A0A5P1EDC0_ASPOF|nr:uncharacterized protein A4U43_C07F19220 [Asparagus officinalis]
MILRRVPDRGLHQALRNYFLQRALLENELFNRVDHLWTSHEELLDEVELLRSNEKALRQQHAEGSSFDISQVAKLRQELNEKNAKVVTIDGYENVPENDENALKKAVAIQPVSVAIEAGGRGFQLYQSDGVIPVTNMGYSYLR